MRFFPILLFLMLFLLVAEVFAQELPLWLEKTLSCEELRKEIKTRYSEIKTVAQVRSDKGKELRLVLDVACSPRFAECNFKNCAFRTASDNLRKKRAREKLAALVSLRRKQQMIHINRKIQQERERGLAWSRIANPRELEILRERRRRQVEAKRKAFKKKNTEQVPKPVLKKTNPAEKAKARKAKQKKLRIVPQVATP